MDDRLHNRRPSDEAANIIRKFSGAGQHPPLVACNMGVSMPDRTGSLLQGMKGLQDGIFQSFDESRFVTLGEERGGRREGKDLIFNLFVKSMFVGIKITV